MKRAFCLLLGAALAGCASPQPDYQRPAAPVPAHWPAADAESGQVDIAWRRFFVDDGLRETIAQALANNRDLRVAAANVQAARAQYRIQDAARLPAVQLQGKADRQLTAAAIRRWRRTAAASAPGWASARSSWICSAGCAA
ncbi:Outer membrane protein oprM precursor [Chromobacterium violaceum]|uniref:Outer membrane protein oprM n=1 Tax=Chromobacterium violaceum TaxID=536 RepID=A0A447TCR5_CHRVL|nr:Outer membrane protein oprM precursor [Chromobacterium violaceum]